MKKIISFMFFVMIFVLLSSYVSAAEPENLSVGKPYTNVRVVSSYFPDTDNKELTDGVFGTRAYIADSAWTGAACGETESGMVYDEWPLYTTIIDLEEICSVTEVSCNFVRDINLGMGFPVTVKVYASLDNVNWMKLSFTNMIFDHIADGVYSFGWHIDNVIKNETIDLVGDFPVKARYIRYDFELRSNMHLIDEITVMGYKGETVDAVTPYDTTMLENGSIMRFGEKTGFVNDLVLVNFTPDKFWSKDTLLPFLGYLDTEGEVVDTLFDTVCLVASMSPNGRVFDTENSIVTIDDWKWALERTFSGELDALNDAAKEVSEKLKRDDYKANLVLMMPFPCAGATEFGALDGISLDLSVTEDWQHAVNWYLNEVISNIEEKNYDYIDFKGFYWINEYPNQPERIIYTNARIKELGFKSYWIPYFHSAGYLCNETLGFDAITLQPNHFFSASTGNTLGAGGTKIVETVAKLGAYADFGVEFEFDLRLDSDKDAYNRFLDYLNTAVNMGFDGEGYYRNWYEAGGGIYGLSVSRAPELRMLYDNIYQMVKGNYKSRDYIEKLNDNILLGKSYTNTGTKWYASRSDDSECVYLTDGEVTGSFYGNNFFGLEKEDATIEFEFSKTPIKEIHIVAFKDLGAGVNLPKNVKISAKTEKGWEVLYDGTFPESLRAVFALDCEVYATGLKFEFTRNGGFLFLKEILAYEKNNYVKHDVSIQNIELYGDVTGNGVVDAGDVIQINRKIANLPSIINSEYLFKVADVTKEGTLNALDVLQINRKIANLSSILG